MSKLQIKDYAELFENAKQAKYCQNKRNNLHKAQLKLHQIGSPEAQEEKIGKGFT